MNNSKRGQVTIWIILGIVFLASVVLFFVVNQGGIELIETSGGESVFEIENYLSSCTRIYVGDAEDILLPQGGFMINRNYEPFDGSNVELWYDSESYYDQGISQYGLPLQDIKEQIDQYLEERFNGECFPLMEEELESSSGTSVEFLEDLNLEVDWAPDRIFLDINRKTRIVKNDQTRTFENVEVEVISPVYDLVKVAQQISLQEGEYCYFEAGGYGVYDPRFVPRKYSGRSDYIKFYGVYDKNSEKEIKLATRGCVVPSGGV